MQINGTSCRAFLSRVALAAALSGCGGSDEKPPGPDVDATAPVVSSTSPADGATRVPVGQVLTAVFSEALRCDTVDGASFRVEGTGPVDGVVACSGATITFDPSAPLAHETTYTATLGTAITDTAGNPLAEPHRWTFSTAEEGGDATPPTVIAVAPADGASGIAVELPQLVATFSEPIDCASVTASSFELGGGTMVAGTIGCDGATATFAPSGPLAHDTGYTATLTTEIRDLAGNHLASPYAWSFATVAAPDLTPPSVVGLHPADEATGVPVDVAIGARFSEPMVEATVVASLAVFRGSQEVPGTVTYAATEHEVVFRPLEPLASGTDYTARITTDATDLAGNHLEAATSWSFRTAEPAGRLLFSWAGDLFAIGEDGTGLVTLAGSSTWSESFAGVSPGGQVVYKLESSELHSVSSDGSGHVVLVGGVTPLSFVGFSSTGRVVFVQEGNLQAIDVDGTDLVTLSGTGDVEPLVLFVGGGRVVFLRTTGGNRTIHSVLDDGTGGVTLDGTPNMKMFYRVGPDGLVYYYRNMSTAYPNSDVVAVAPDGSAPPIAIAATTTYSEDLAAIAPDGTPVIVGCLSVWCEEELLFPGGAELNLGRGGVRGLTPGNRIVFESGELGQLNVGTCALDGSGVVTVAGEPALNEDVVGIHPDGHILYRSHPTSTSDLFGVLADGSGAVTLAATADHETLVGISPDGWIVIDSTGNGTNALRAIRSDGSGARTLVQSSYWLQFAGFGPSGKMLYLSGEEGGGVNLWIVGFDGAPPVKLTDHSSLAPEYFGNLP